MAKPIISRVKGKSSVISISISLSKEVAVKALHDLISKYGEDIKIKITETGNIAIEIIDNGENGHDDEP